MRVSYADFDYVRKMVYELSAISLDNSKDYLVEARLAPIVHREGLASVAELVASLRSGCERLRDDVVAAVATNETSFFRDVHPFEALGDVILPGVLAANGGQHLAMWSAAASTGQEAYSLAMLVRERFPALDDVTILATDLSADILDRARSGRFTHLEANRGLPARLLVKHFEQDGRDWLLKPDVRKMVTFRHHNLARPFVGVPRMDVILLRNVLIYFDTPTKAAVLREVARVLRPGGHLFLGTSETTYGIDDSYERVQVGKTVCYRLANTERSSTC